MMTGIISRPNDSGLVHRKGAVGILVKVLCCCGAVLLSVATLAAGNDLRLLEAVRKGDTKAVRSLLEQNVDVNSPQKDGATALAWAAHRDDLETAALLIAAGANVNSANDYGVTPLSLACLNGSAPMVEKLLKAGANPNAVRPTGETPLMTAARTGNVEVVKSLLGHGAQVNAKETRRGQTALMWAVAEKHPRVVRTLIEHRADVHIRSKSGFTALLFAAQQGELESARILLAAGASVKDETQEDGSALVVASASGHEELSLFFLLDKGANPNATDGYGITPLHYAILKGLARVTGVRTFDPDFKFLARPNMVKLAHALLERGADPHARVPMIPKLAGARMLRTMSPIGATPFLLAAASHDAGLMRALVAKGADPLLTEQENTTPLMMAAGLAEGFCYLVRTEEDERKALEAVKLALELGADVNAANKLGLTAMHGAAYVGSNGIIQFLVSKGAKVDVKDQFGQTPWSVAERFYPETLVAEEVRPKYVYKATADLLLKLGATPMTASTAPLGRE